MTAGHTPGEWSVWTTMDNTLVIYAEAPGQAIQPMVADIHPIGKRPRVPYAGQSEYDAPGDTPSEEERANARLIAASPALLAACKAALVPAGDTPQQVQAQLLAAIKLAEEGANYTGRYCRHCGGYYEYFPDIDPLDAARYCSVDCYNCVVAGQDDTGRLLAPCGQHKEAS